MAEIALTSLSHKIAEIIIERIIRKKILPGERLLEIKIAREFGVSQGTVREALRILEKKKMATIHARKGSFVTMLDSSYVDSLYDILVELYCLMARKVAKNLSARDIKELSSNMKILHACARMKDGYGYGEAMYKGIDMLLRIAKDALLEQTVKDLWLVMRWIEYEMLLNHKSQLLDNYKRLKRYNDLLISGKIDEANQLLREHTQYLKQFALESIGNPPGADPLPSPEKRK